jgi:hypothetical protein
VLLIRIRIRIRIRIQIRIRIASNKNPDPDLHPDPHQSDKLDRIRINLQMTSRKVWNVSLFEHCFKV